MLFLFPVMHAMDDDLAPIDYTAVPSVSEGRRRAQAQRMHRPDGPTAPIVRHRVEPDRSGGIPEYGGRTRMQSASPKPERELMTRLPSLQDGPVPVQSVAMPDEYGIPDNPFLQPADEAPRRRRTAQPAPQPVSQPAPQPAPQPVQPVGTGARTAMPAITREDGSQFDAPVTPDIPDWLRVAQQNNLPLYRQQAPAPRVQAAPRMDDAPAPTDALGRPLHNRHNVAAARRQPMASDAYQDAGYPQQLLDMQRQLEAEAASTPVRRRHGAQYAVDPYRQQAQQRQMQPPQPREPYRRPEPAPDPYAMQRGYQRPQRAPADYEVETDEAESGAASILRRIPWLGIAAFVAALVAVFMWVTTSQYRTQIQQVIDGRAAQEEAIARKHPMAYQELIHEKANKYNLHPAFVCAIMLNESSFDPTATSRVDARGLMQLMDDTAGWIHDKMDLTTPYSFDDLYDPEVNVEFGCWYLNYLSNQFYGDPILVAAAFHAGQGEVRNWLNTSAYSADGRSIRLEDMIDGPTKQYVTRVLNAYAVYKRLYYGG